MIEVLICKNQVLSSHLNITWLQDSFRGKTCQFLEPFRSKWAPCRGLAVQPSGQGKFRSIQFGLIRDLNLDFSMPAPCNREKASSGKTFAQVAWHQEPRLKELPLTEGGV